MCSKLYRRLATIFSCLLLAAVVNAGTPSTISYQGRLTDPGGAPVPDGAYMVNFAIYTVPVGGGAIWTEFQGVTTTDGLFSVLLGSANPLTAAIFGDSARYLGITVGGDPELAPRTKLATAPYSFRTATVDGATGGSVYGGVDILTSTLAKASFYDFFGLGTSMDLLDELGGLHSGMETDVHGSGGYMYVTSGAGYGVFVDGNFNATGDPVAHFNGSVSTATFDLSVAGDASIQLPLDAVSSSESLDEPGVASNSSTGFVALTSTMQDLITVSITIPAPGYIFVNGMVGEIDLSNTTGGNWVFVQIDETAGGIFATPYFTVMGSQDFPTTLARIYSTDLHRVFYKSSAGTYVFRLEAMRSGSGAGALANTFYPRLTAVYLPTSYGSVVAAIAGTDVSEFEHVTTEISQVSPASGAAPTNVNLVDLRELELKVAKEEAEAQKARAALAEAQVKAQFKDRATQIQSDTNK